MDQIHFVWRQAKTALITRDTKSIFLVSQVLGELAGDVVEKVLNELSVGVQMYFDVVPHAFIVDGQNPTISQGL